jgi:hypothetical protein
MTILCPVIPQDTLKTGWQMPSRQDPDPPALSVKYFEPHIGLNREVDDPDESRPVEYAGERSREPRDSENWQRAVRRIINGLRAEAASLAETVR